MSALDKKKTFTALQFVPLVESDLSIRSAKRQLVYGTHGLKGYNEGYWRWKHEYRTRYSEKFLAKYGFEPTEQGQTIALDFDLLRKHLETKLVDLDRVKYYKFTIPSLEMQFKYYMQENGYVWSNETEILTHSGHDWELEYVSYKETNDPFDPDDETLIFASFKRVDADQYLTFTIPNYYRDESCIEVQYTKIGIPEPEWYIYIDLVSTLPTDLYNTKELTLTPVVPMKEDSKITLETKEMRKMMRKLNVDSEDFEEVLTKKDETCEDNDCTEEEAIDNAYIMNGLSFINPYEIEPGTYDSVEAEDFSTAFLSKLSKSGNVESVLEKSGIMNFEITKRYTVTQEIADKWYDDHLREQAYLARGLFRSFAYYAGIHHADFEKKRLHARYIGNCVDDVNNAADPETNVQSDPELEQSMFGRFPVFGGTTNGMYTVNASISKLNMIYSYDISVTTYKGRVRPSVVDKRSQASFHFSGTKVSREDDEQERDKTQTADSLGYDLLVIRAQVDEEHYQEMRITGFSSVFQISGKTFHNTLGFPFGENKMILPYFAIQNLGFTEYVTVYEHSFCLLAYAKTTIVIKWYKRWQGVLLGLAFCVFGGAGCALGAALINAAISIAITLALEWLMEMIDSDILKLLVGMAFSLVQMAIGAGGFDMLTAENYLKLANEVVQQAFGYFQAQQLKEAAERQKLIDANENIDERIGNFEDAGSASPKAIMSAHYSFNETHGPDAFYGQALGNALYNYDQFYDVDREIELRKQVKSG